MEQLEFKEAVIEFEGKQYTIDEPTISTWNNLNQLRDFQNEWDFGLSMICMMTGLSEEEIMECDYQAIKDTTENLSSWLMETQEKFYEEFDFRGITYKFIDLNNLKFGEWIDLDFFLQKPLSYRQKNLNELMALLYREKDKETGKVVKYNSLETKKRALLFEQLPVRYLRGSMVFFYALENILLNPTLMYSINRKWLRMNHRINKLTNSVGGGITRSYIYLKRIFLKSMKSRNNLL
jgi:hypothetical protein